MKVNEELIRHVGKISRLKLTDEEVKKFVPQFEDILNYFSVLDEVDVTDTKISIQPVEVRNVLRDDVPKACLSQDEALSQSNHNKKDGYFKGPKAV